MRLWFRTPWPRAAALLVGSSLALGCDREEPPAPAASARASTPTPSINAVPPDVPRLLFLPDAGDVAPPSAPFPELGQVGLPAGRCGPEMVEVKRTFCIDRYETSLVDAQGRSLSPYYHPKPERVRATFDHWRQRSARSKTALGRALEVPEPPAWQLSEPFDIRAVSQRGVVPSGYLSLDVAARACANAGKRLCTHDEWLTACKGEQGHKYPYGPSYQADTCNVHRPAHPASLLHGNASIHHTDPRLNTAHDHGDPLLRRTGETSGCKSTWGNDAIYDMVGNLDEWIADPDGTFVGGFFSRATKAGCDAAISSHPPEYFDYSLGTRCCRDLR